MEKDGCVVIAEVETDNGTLSVVKDSKHKKWYHVFNNTENVQPNHDGEGVMRYLAHVLHSVIHKHKKEKAALEAKLKLVEKFFYRTRPDSTDVDLISNEGDWEIIFPIRGNMLVRNNKTKTGWVEYQSFEEMMNAIYNKMDS